MVLGDVCAPPAANPLARNWRNPPQAGFRVLGFRVWGLGCGVWGLGFDV